MNKIIRHIPNTITCLNLFSGCIATIMAFEGNYLWGAIWIALAALFDFCDGMAARLLGAYSEVGKELDSLADVVSFGVAPAIMVFTLTKSLPVPAQLAGVAPYLNYIAFLLAVFSGLRLARFNVLHASSDTFIGLPVPANALFWVGIVFHTLERPLSVLYIYALVLLFSYLLVSPIPLLSLKFKSLNFKANYLRYILLLVSTGLIALLGWSGLAAAIGFYIILSLLAAKKIR